MNLGLKGLLLLLAVVLFIVAALSNSSFSGTRGDLLYWGLAVFAASFIVESLPLGGMMRRRTP